MISGFQTELHHTILELSWTNTNDAIFVIGQDGSIVAANPAFSTILGWEVKEIKGDTFPPFLSHLSKEEYFALLNEFRNGKDLPYVVTKGIRKDGTILDLLASYRVVNTSDVLAVVLYIDLTETMNIQRKMIESEDKYRKLVDLLPDAIFLQTKGKVVYTNSAGVKLLGCKSQLDILGRSIWKFIQTDKMKKFVMELSDKGSKEVDKKPIVERFVRFDGEIIWGEVNASPIDCDGEKGIQILFRDITEKKTYEAQLEHMAFHDPLTGLKNRRSLTEIIEHSIVEAKDHGGKMAIMYIDIDNFKEINDSFGHDFGDEVLKSFTSRLKDTVRLGDVLSRIGGDEFIILLKDIKHRKDIVEITNRMKIALQDPYNIDDVEITVTCSIGISIFPENGLSSKKLISYADQALYKAKKNKNQIILY
jgi:diguanylate cyclase (GGDEF)-like protein/PAS domain S-box-containing protein